MKNVPKLTRAIQRFNQGTDFYNRALDAFNEKNIPEFENSLRTSATESIGALEWLLKIYLRSIQRNALRSEDIKKLHHPNFSVLLELMREYADPKVEESEINLLYEYRGLLRNAAEHDAAIPSCSELYQAIGKIRDLILRYLPVESSYLHTPKSPEFIEMNISKLQEKYFNTLKNLYEYMDLGGISPRVGSKVVKIRLDDLFVSIEGILDKDLFTHRVSAESSVTETEIETTFEFAEEDEEDNIEVPGLIQRSNVFKQNKLKFNQIFEISRIVVLGHPGAGKTTISKYLAYSIATGCFESIGAHFQNFIPIVIRAIDYALALKSEPGLTLKEFIEIKYYKQFSELIIWAMRSGKALIIIDGLDEIPETKLRTITSRHIEQLVSEFQSNRFIITSRIIGYSQSPLSGNFTHVTLTDLDEETIQLFLKKWHRAVEAESSGQVDDEKSNIKAIELWRSIKASRGIRKLASNPLLLTIIALANWRGTKLPNRRVELYQIATETLIENWPLKQRGISLDSDEILAILEPIAFHIHSRGINNLISEFELRPLFEEQVVEVRGVNTTEAKRLSKKLLYTIEIDTGFFLQKGFDDKGQKVYGFLHQTFAEYLSARYFAERWSLDLLDLNLYVHNDRWHEVILLMAGHIGTWATAQATKLVSDILHLQSPYEKYLHRDLFLSADILADNVRVSREIQDQIISGLIDLVIERSEEQLIWRSLNCISEISNIFHLGKTVSNLVINPRDEPQLKVRKALIQRYADINNYEALRQLFSNIKLLDEEEFEINFWIHDNELIPESDDPTHLFITSHKHGISYHRVSSDTAEILNSFNDVIFGLNDLKEYRDTDENYSFWLIGYDDLVNFDINSLIKILNTSDWIKRAIITSGFALRHAEDTISILKKVINHINGVKSSDELLNTLEAIIQLISRSLHRDPERLLDHFTALVMLVWDIYNQNNNLDIKMKCLEIILNFKEKINIDPYMKKALSDPDERIQSMIFNLFFRSGYTPHDQSYLASLREETFRGSAREAQSRYLLFNKQYDTDEEFVNLVENGLNSNAIDEIETFESIEWLRELTTILLTTESIELRKLITDRITKIIQLIKEENRDLSDYSWLLFRDSRKKTKIAKFNNDWSRLIQHENPNIRIFGVQLWSIVRREGHVPLSILNLFDDPHPSVRSATIRVLRSSDINQEYIASKIINIVREDSELGEIAVYALSRKVDEEVKKMIIKEMDEIFRQSKENHAAFTILWNLVNFEDRFFGDIVI